MAPIFISHQWTRHVAHFTPSSSFKFFTFYSTIFKLLISKLFRNDALNFQMSKSQKKMLKANRQYLDTNEIKSSKLSSKKESIQDNERECTECSQKNIKTNATKVIEFILNKTGENNLKGEKEINDLIGIAKIKSKHKRLYRKLLALKEKNLISSNSGIFRAVKSLYY